ncbi:MAG: ABC transporter permease [Ilumatobacteraceae bacterium]
MTGLVLRRLTQALGTLLGGAVITFLLLAATPGDPAERILAARGKESATPTAVAALREQLGLDRSLLVRLGEYLRDLLHGDLGTSWSTGRPVASELGRRLPATLRLTVAALALAIVLSLLLGLLAAWGAGRIPDLVSRLLSMVFLVVPSFLLGIVILDLVVVRLGIGVVVSDGTWATVLLPAITLALGSAASWSRVLRASLLDAHTAAFLTVSRARGTSRLRRLLVHELPNAIPPFITIIGLEIAVLLGGAPIVESIFSWPGVGRFTVQAVGSRDMPVVVGFVMLAITLFVVSSLVVDLVNALIDPRQRAR